MTMLVGPRNGRPAVPFHDYGPEQVVLAPRGAPRRASYVVKANKPGSKPKVRRVRTPAGAKKYGQPIGTIITADMVKHLNAEKAKAKAARKASPTQQRVAAGVTLKVDELHSNGYGPPVDITDLKTIDDLDELTDLYKGETISLADFNGKKGGGSVTITEPHVEVIQFHLGDDDLPYIEGTDATGETYDYPIYEGLAALDHLPAQPGTESGKKPVKAEGKPKFSSKDFKIGQEYSVQYDGETVTGKVKSKSPDHIDLVDGPDHNFLYFEYMDEVFQHFKVKDEGNDALPPGAEKLMYPDDSSSYITGHEYAVTTDTGVKYKFKVLDWDDTGVDIEITDKGNAGNWKLGQKGTLLTPSFNAIDEAWDITPVELVPKAPSKTIGVKHAGEATVEVTNPSGSTLMLMSGGKYRLELKNGVVHENAKFIQPKKFDLIFDIPGTGMMSIPVNNITQVDIADEDKVQVGYEIIPGSTESYFGTYADAEDVKQAIAGLGEGTAISVWTETESGELGAFGGGIDSPGIYGVWIGGVLVDYDQIRAIGDKYALQAPTEPALMSGEKPKPKAAPKTPKTPKSTIPSSKIGQQSYFDDMFETGKTYNMVYDPDDPNIDEGWPLDAGFWKVTSKTSTGVYFTAPGYSKIKVPHSVLADYLKAGGKINDAGYVADPQVASKAPQKPQKAPESPVQSVKPLSIHETTPTPLGGVSAPPFSTAEYKASGGQGGSNPGGMFTDSEGTKWYVKGPQVKGSYASSFMAAEDGPALYNDRSRSEVLSARLYAQAGVGVPEVELLDITAAPFYPNAGPGSLGVRSKVTPDKKQNVQTAINDPAYREEVWRGFAMDAWLGNWDTVGLAYDNIAQTKDGKSQRIDTGASFWFRAQGGLKDEGNFGPEVGEIDTLRNSNNNPQSAAVFGAMGDADIRQSIKDTVATITDAQIDKMVDEMGFETSLGEKTKDMLKKRRISMAKRFGVSLPDHPETAGWEQAYDDKIKYFYKAWGFQTEDEYLHAKDVLGGTQGNVEKFDQSVQPYGYTGAADALSVLDKVHYNPTGNPLLVSQAQNIEALSLIATIKKDTGRDIDEIAAGMDEQGWGSFDALQDTWHKMKKDVDWQHLKYADDAEVKDAVNDPFSYAAHLDSMAADADYKQQFDEWVQVIKEENAANLEAHWTGLANPFDYPESSTDPWEPTQADVQANNEFKVALHKSNIAWAEAGKDPLSNAGSVAKTASEHMPSGAKITAEMVKKVRDEWGGTSTHGAANYVQWGVLDVTGFDLDSIYDDDEDQFEANLAPLWDTYPGQNGIVLMLPYTYEDGHTVMFPTWWPSKDNATKTFRKYMSDMSTDFPGMDVSMREQYGSIVMGMYENTQQIAENLADKGLIDRDENGEPIIASVRKLSPDNAWAQHYGVHITSDLHGKEPRWQKINEGKGGKLISIKSAQSSSVSPSAWGGNVMMRGALPARYYLAIGPGTGMLNLNGSTGEREVAPILSEDWEILYTSGNAGDPLGTNVKEKH